MNRRFFTWACTIALAWTVAGCSSTHYPVNVPLAQADAARGYRMQSLVRHVGDEEMFVVLTFSGGGTRAAALAFGVLEELARTQVVWRGERKRLIDEVDLVYGVSGGSIAAAYWALRGDQALADFGARFLTLDLQSQLLDTLKSPQNMWRLGSPRFGRGELLEERLNDTLFHGATFADLNRRAQGPFVVVSAADLSTGARFDFTQDYFDLLCSDLGAFPIARAVAASSSVPMVFSPITLWNYAGTCHYTPSRRVAAATGGSAPRHLGESREQLRAREMASYLNAAEKPYVHLVDGGVADNLAARGLLEAASMARDPAEQGPRQPPRKVVVITVDAGTDAVNAIDQSADVPTAGAILQALADIPIQRYSAETRLLLQGTFDEWQRQAQHGDAAAPQLYTVDVSLRGVADDRTRHSLLRLPTSLHLPASDVRALREAAAVQMHASPGFQRLLQDVGPK